MELYSKLLSDRGQITVIAIVDDIFTLQFVHQDNNDDSIGFFVTKFQIDTAEHPK